MAAPRADTPSFVGADPHVHASKVGTPKRFGALPKPAAAVPAAEATAAASAAATKDLADALDKLDVSAAVRAVVGLDRQVTNSVGRRAAMQLLTRELPADDVAALRLFLRIRLAEQVGLRPEEFFALKNDILDVLLRQERFPQGMGLDLAGMYHDRGQDAVWRDYCVQYLAECHARLLDGAKDVDPQADERTAIIHAYEEALTERDSTIAGTALIGMEQVSRADANLDRGRVRQLAVEIATDEGASEASRVTALRVAAMMDSRGVLPVARMLAQVGQTSMLRIAAVATLGDIGSHEDAELLRAVAEGADKRMKPVVEGARKRLKEQLAKAEHAPGADS